MKKFSNVILVMGMLVSIQLHGQTWSGLTRLTWNPGDSLWPIIATDAGSGIHVVWGDYSTVNSEIFYKKSTDNGTTWTGLTRMTWNSGDSWLPSVAADSNTGIHVVWDDGTPGNREIYYKRSTDSGATWSGLTRMTWNSGASSAPVVAADSSNRIHVVWYDGTSSNAEILHKRSTDGGATWSGITRLTFNSGDSLWPSIATDSSGGIHVVWEDGTPGNDEIFYKSSSDSGVTWSGLTRLTWNADNSYTPSIAADSTNGIHVVWCDTPGNGDIFYKRSTDSGANWSGITRLTWNSGGSYEPCIAADSSGGIHLIWEDGTPGNEEIFYKSSSDSGATWSAITRLTWNSGESYYPSIAGDSSSGCHTVWCDETPGNFDIYYKNRK